MAVRIAERLPSRPRRAARIRRPTPTVGYHRLLVPVADNPESERAVDTACRLAAERDGSITALAVVEVPPLLPLDAHMIEEEEAAHRMLARAEAIGARFGVGTSLRIVRGRDAASAIVEQACVTGAEMVVVGGVRKARRGSRAPVFGRTLQHVLTRAPCPVMVVASPRDAARRAA